MSEKKQCIKCVNIYNKKCNILKHKDAQRQTIELRNHTVKIINCKNVIGTKNRANTFRPSHFVWELFKDHL